MRTMSSGIPRRKVRTTLIVAVLFIAAASAAPHLTLLNAGSSRLTTAHPGIPAAFTDVLPVTGLALLPLKAPAIAVMRAAARDLGGPPPPGDRPPGRVGAR